MYAHREGAPGAELALVADCSGETVTGDDLDRTVALFNKAVNRDRFPNRVLGLLVDLDGCPVILRIGDHDGDATERAVVVRPAGPDLQHAQCV